MSNKKGTSFQWILLPVLFSSAAVLASDQGVAEDPCMQCPTVASEAAMPQGLVQEPPMSGDYVRRGGAAAAAVVDAPAPASAQAEALSQEADGFADDAQEVSTGNMNFVGGNTRIGVGIDTEFKGRADVSHIFSESESSTTSGQGWVGINPKADKDKNEEVLTGAGVKLNHHWVSTDEGGQPAHVNKVFGAYDQNAAKDKKATFGYGQETEDLFWSGHVSKGLSDRRVSGKTADGKDIYEKAYDFGVGGRVGTFMDDQLMRVQGGLDYEWGTENAASEKKPSQLTVTGGVEKFFVDSPHSVGANIEVLKEQGGYVGDEHKADVRGNVNYRYDFGSDVFAADQKYRRVRVEIPGKTIVTKQPPKVERKVERKLVKHTMELESDTFFEVGKHALTGDAQNRLRSVMARIRDSGHEGNIRITGNTCDKGATDYNQALSERRAAAVRSFMAANGFDPQHLLARGLGETHPKYPNTPETAHKNRRVDIEYVAYETKYKDEYKDQVVQQGREIRTQTEPQVVWRKELIPTPPSWVGQALHNNIQYKQTIDTYRTLGAAGGTGGAGNGAPTAVNDTDITTTVGTAVNINVTDLLDNDTDPNGDTLTITSFTQPAHGTLTLTGGVFTYTPVAGYTGSDSFTYTISDGHGGTSTATVSLTVNAGAVNTVPVAVNDYDSTTPDTKVTINALANDRDADGDTLTITRVDDTSAEGGTITLVNGQFSYTPAAGFVGTDTFTYTISDGRGGEATATVTVTVTADGANHEPTVLDDEKTTPQDTAVVVDALANDYDLDGDTLTISNYQATSDEGGTVALVDGKLRYTPAAGFVGTDTFTYEVSDGNGGTATAMVTVTVSAATGNQAPIAVDDAKTAVMDTKVTIAALANDSDADGDMLTITSFDELSAEGGVVSVVEGNFSYTPASGFTGTDTFNYTISDGNGGTATATVTITVSASSGGMIPDDDHFKIGTADLDSNGKISLDVLDGDQYSDPVSIRIISYPSKGSILNVDAAGSVSGAMVSYEPDSTTGTDSFVYVLVDASGNVSPEATVTIELSNGSSSGLDAVEDGADGKDAEYNFTYANFSGMTTARTLHVLGNDIGEGLSIVSLTQPRFGSAKISADGQTIVYMPRSGYCEDHSFTYTIRDKNGNEETTTVYININ